MHHPLTGLDSVEHVNPAAGRRAEPQRTALERLACGLHERDRTPGVLHDRRLRNRGGDRRFAGEQSQRHRLPGSKPVPFGFESETDTDGPRRRVDHRVDPERRTERDRGLTGTRDLAGCRFGQRRRVGLGNGGDDVQAVGVDHTQQRRARVDRHAGREPDLLDDAVERRAQRECLGLGGRSGTVAERLEAEVCIEVDLDPGPQFRKPVRPNPDTTGQHRGFFQWPLRRLRI